MNIYSAISSVMSEIGAITKDKTNQQQGFKYRGVDDVMNALQPLLIKYKVFAVPETLEHIREQRETKGGGTLIYSICKIKYTFYAEDGSNIVAVVIGEGMDSGDKATNKAMAIAFKYACFQVFCIPTEEMKDPDGESHDLKPQNAPQDNKPSSNNTNVPKENKPVKTDSTHTPLTFGKYKGKTVNEIALIDEKYISWLAENSTTASVKKEAEEWLNKAKSGIGENKIDICQDCGLPVTNCNCLPF